MDNRQALSRHAKSIFYNQNIPYILIIVSALALIYRARYSFCWSDESFYFSTSNRFLTGDSIFVNEWFPTQLVSIILLPFHALFKCITGGNNGVILYFRILYVILSAVIATTIYRIMSSRMLLFFRGSFVPCVVSLLYLYYAHLNIATMSYYTLSESFFLLSMLLLYRYFSVSELNNTTLIISGFFLALAVLSLPTLAVAYFAYTIALVILSIKYNRLRPVFPFMLIGILIPAIPVLIYTLCTSGIDGILHNLTYVLSDEEHATSLVYPFKNFFLAVFDVFKRPICCFSVLMAAVALIYNRFKKFIGPRESSEHLFTICFFSIDLLLFIYYSYCAFGHTGFISTAFLLFAMPLFFLTRKRDYRLFICVFMMGMTFSMVFSYSSMCDLYVLSIGHFISLTAAVCFVWDFLLESKMIKPLFLCGIAAIMFTLLTTMALRFTNIYRDAPVECLTALIDDGPAAGLYTTAQHKADYDLIRNAIKEFEKKGEPVFFTKLLPWGYLDTDMTVGAPTTWRTKLSSDRLRLYYTEHPEKIPTVIYVLDDRMGSYDTCGDVEYDPTPNENELSGYLYDYIVYNNYEKVSFDGVTVFYSSDNN